jgi:hypothetical protein
MIIFTLLIMIFLFLLFVGLVSFSEFIINR